MPNFKVLSWNVQNLGETKAYVPGIAVTYTQIVPFLAMAIAQEGADIVGLMEIQGGVGRQVLHWLITLLNGMKQPANAPYVWTGRVSSRQSGGTQEEAIYLWKNLANVLELDANAAVGPVSSIGVADVNAFESLTTGMALSPAQKEAAVQSLLDALKASGYLQNGVFGKGLVSSLLRVVPDMWNTINTTPNSEVQFSGTSAPPAQFTGQPARQRIATLLQNIDVLRFVTNGDRSPFMASLLVNGKSLMLALLHAPGPKEFPNEANNVMHLSLPMQAQVAADRNLLIMGDFNVDDAKLDIKTQVFDRFTNNKGKFLFARKPKTFFDIFQPITGAPLNAPDLLAGEKTSLTTDWLTDASPHDDALASTYDKFFFRPGTTAATQITQANPAQVVPLLLKLASNQAAVFTQALAVSAMSHYRAYRGPDLQKRANGIDASIKKWQNEVDILTLWLLNNPLPAPKSPKKVDRAAKKRFADKQRALRDAKDFLKSDKSFKASYGPVVALLGNPLVTTATGVGSALLYYRSAISDHLPISVELTA